MGTQKIQAVAAKAMILILAVAVMAGAALAAPPAWKGSFTLTQETRWATAVLTPGHYTFTLNGVPGSSQLIITVHRGDDRAIFVMPVGQSIDKVHGQSALILTGASAGSAVRELRLAEIDLTLSFAVPRSAMEEAKNSSPKEVAVAAEK
jgi:hypothetical protein